MFIGINDFERRVRFVSFIDARRGAFQ